MRFGNNPYTVLGIALVVFFGTVGFLDDLIKLREECRRLMAMVKLLLMTLGSLGVGITLYYFAVEDGKLSHLSIVLPFAKEARIPLYSLGVIPWLLWCFILVAGAGNAVNITDGLDGLASGLCVLAGGTMAVVCYIAGRIDFSSYLYIPYIPGAGEVSVIMASLVGACLGFLWFNCNPALIFMGDTGSLPLGGLLGFSALVSRHEYVLLLAGGIFVVQALSVMIQVGVFKLTGKRVFPFTPIHHIPQLRGMPENRIVVRFWIVGSMLSVGALAALKIR